MKTRPIFQKADLAKRGFWGPGKSEVGIIPSNPCFFSNFFGGKLKNWGLIHLCPDEGKESIPTHFFSRKKQSVANRDLE